jgi:hypothetical protein
LALNLVLASDPKRRSVLICVETFLNGRLRDMEVRIMRKLLFGLTAAATLAFAVPGAALAAHNGGGHGGDGRGGGSAHFTGGHMSGGMARSSGVRSFNASRSIQSNRSVNVNRSVNTRNLSANSRNFTRNSNNRMASNGHRHHRHGGGGWWPGYFYGGYDDYAGYDNCYQYAWTPGGYRYVNTCGSDYGVY